MYNPVLPHDQRPVFLQTNVGYIFTHIAVDRVAAADGQYDVLFIGTGLFALLPFPLGKAYIYVYPATLLLHKIANNRMPRL